MTGITKETSEEFMRMIGLKGTRGILEFLNENEKGQYKDFIKFANNHVLTLRLRQLLVFGLIEHHLTREVKRVEWYTITEKGRKILQYLKKMEEIISE